MGLSLKKNFSAPLLTYTLNTDWYGARLPAHITVDIKIEEQKLLFAARFFGATDYDKTIPAGAFTTELWRRDTAEVFIACKNTDSYVELNLSPTGAFWSSRFTNYREPDATWKAQQDTGYDSATQCIILDLAASLQTSDINELLIIPHGILQVADDQKFLTAMPFPDQTPDFHNKDHWQKNHDFLLKHGLYQGVSLP